jgi:hypothetical protein
MADKPAPSPLAAIFASRKGIAAFVAFLFGLVAVVGLTVAAVMGKITWDTYFSRVEVIGGTVTAALVAFILGTAHEDAAAKSAGSPPDSGAGAT